MIHALSRGIARERMIARNHREEGGANLMVCGGARFGAAHLSRARNDVSRSCFVGVAASFVYNVAAFCGE